MFSLKDTVSCPVDMVGKQIDWITTSDGLCLVPFPDQLMLRFVDMSKVTCEVKKVESETAWEWG